MRRFVEKHIHLIGEKWFDMQPSFREYKKPDWKLDVTNTSLLNLARGTAFLWFREKTENQLKYDSYDRGKPSSLTFDLVKYIEDESRK